ncbi:RNA-directed DNA polymerase, eukaryota, partial [Tanacetum coccineum]
PIENGRNGTSLTELLSELHSVTLTFTPNTWKWLLSKDSMFSVSDTQIHINSITLPINSYDSLWSNLLPIKVNIFIWRLCLDRLPHRLNLSLRGLEIESLRCPSCYTGIESADHIFFTCSLAKEVWRLIFKWGEFSAQQLNSFSYCRSWLGSFSGSKIKCDHLLVINVATCWTLWKYRNAIIFSSHQMRKCDIFDNIRLVSFSWLKNRGNHLSNWQDWLKTPL